MTDEILVSDDARVRTIRFNRPGKKNAITRAMYTAMAEALESANEAEVRVVIIAGSDGVFSAGNDLVDFMEAPPHIGGGDTPPVERFMRALMGCEKPVIAAVDGLAVGIGTTLLLHCDLAYATPRAVFSAPFVNLALAPEFGSSQILPGLVGRVVASELLLLGAKWDADKAAAKHLVTDVLPEAGFEDAVRAIAADLAGKAPGAVKTAKMLIGLPEEDLQGRIVREGGLFADQLRSEEFKEAATAFMERRAPDFSRFD
ncbi:MAG: enoyl-CoA hydratase-related protein [Oceanicaulis sp.]